MVALAVSVRPAKSGEVCWSISFPFVGALLVGLSLLFFAGFQLDDQRTNDEQRRETEGEHSGIDDEIWLALLIRTQ